jgi:phosphoglycolate phosphatase
MIKAVLLDLDDTLFLTQEASFQMDNKVAQEMGYEPVTRKEYSQFWGMPIEESTVARFPGINLVEFLDRFSQVIKQSIEQGDLDILTNENKQALRELKKLGKRLFVVTSRRLMEVQHLLEPGHDLGEFIEKFYYLDNLPYHKPDPRVFSPFLSEYNFAPKECVYVGDSFGDAAAAKGAGLHFIATLEGGLRREEDFKDYPVDLYIQEFPRIVAAIKKLDERLL